MSLINRVLDDLSRRRSAPELAEINLQEMGVQSTRQGGERVASVALQERLQQRPVQLGLLIVLLLVVGVSQDLLVVPPGMGELVRGLSWPEWLGGAPAEKPVVEATVRPVVNLPAPARVVEVVAPPVKGGHVGAAVVDGAKEESVSVSAAPPSREVEEKRREWSVSPPVVLTLPDAPCALPSKEVAGGEGVIWQDREPVKERRKGSVGETAGTDLLWQARSALLQGDLQRTGDVLRQVPDRLLESLDYRILLAAWHQQSGVYDLAAEDYRWLIEREPERGSWWLGRAIALENLGRQREAMAAYLEAEGHRDLQGEVKRFIRERLMVLQGQGQ
ncbi:MAG: hypothetical protein HQM04_02150 [Magnetococcales bacterium]|nr:hypothetical protein [Magnetococcales bacterium]MBF0113821.1 hypothetical protein [Magnetococcales bacterium]